MVQVDARSCTSAAAQELSDFSYHCSYTPPDGDHIYTEGCCCVRCGSRLHALLKYEEHSNCMSFFERIHGAGNRCS